MATDGNEHPGTGALLEEALAVPTMARALKRVRKNKGSPGIDGMTADELPDWLRDNWHEVRGQLLAGTYQPSPVRRVRIPKPAGGERELGIPTVVDRLIQQALLQVLQPLVDPTFSEHSYGFRPGRSAHDALGAMRGHVLNGKTWVVDVDIEKFFDRVNHDVLMGRLARRIDDRRVLRLIRAYLNAGILAEGVVMQKPGEGTPQGGPLSPLLANILLDEVDKELEKRGHAFVRYADDLRVFVGSQRAGDRVMRSLVRQLSKLRLRVNESKSATAPVGERPFLGFRFRETWKGWRLHVSPKALNRMKDRVRRTTRRIRGRSLDEVIHELSQYLRGWRNYFRAAEGTHWILKRLDKWIRHRLRAYQLKQWKTSRNIRREVLKLTGSRRQADSVAGFTGHWWAGSVGYLNTALPIAHFDALGLPRLSG